MSTCGTCLRKFPAGRQSREQHLKATGHSAPDFECDRCDKFFGSQQAVNQHMTNRDHWEHSSDDEGFECDDCDDVFREEQELRDHEVEEHFYCDPCDRYFQDFNSVHQHRHGKIHRGNTVQCPFCKCAQGTATGLVHHIERGSCPKAPLNREMLYEAVRSRDPNGVISKHLLCSADTTSYVANDRAWNPIARAFVCYLCGRNFGKLTSLNQHLSSPVHQQNLYHCPNRGRCRKESSTLAAMMNHIESESCGYMRFEAVQRNVQHILDPRRLIQG